MRKSFNFSMMYVVGVCACVGCDGGDPSPEPPLTTPRFTMIAAIQGSGNTSPLEGQEVSIDGVVTGDFQDNDRNTDSNLGGFFVQNDVDDKNSATSDGIFVFDGNSPTVDVAVGDRVTVSGSVQEHFGETQIVATAVAINGSGTIQPKNINFPIANVTSNSDDDPISNLEHLEGMLISFQQRLTITDIFNLERYGSIRLAEGGRLYQFTNRNTPGAFEYAAHRRTIAAKSIVLDDGQRVSNASPVRYLNGDTGANSAIRVGDTVTGIVGNLRYSRGSGGSGMETWRVMPTSSPSFKTENPAPAAPIVNGAVRIASFNVLNYFSTIDNGQDNCGPSRNDGCRGADSVAEQSRQLAKIATALAMIDADIVGLIELENNANKSLQDIVDALNARSGAATYTWLNTGTIGSGVIKNGFVYKPASVSPNGAFALLDQRVDPRFADGRNRMALAQTFSAAANAAKITVIVNHLKSKGSDCEAEGDPNTGDGQGNCNQTRSNAAAAIADWIATDPTASNDADFLIIGDLNAYLKEDPLTTLENRGFINLLASASGPDAYSFIFDGQSGALDHALASPNLARQVVDIVDWHINADEAPIRDYNVENDRDRALFDGATPFRASDHDPIIIGIDLN